jgi:hypothetical protein
VNLLDNVAEQNESPSKFKDVLQDKEEEISDLAAANNAFGSAPLNISAEEPLIDVKENDNDGVFN